MTSAHPLVPGLITPVRYWRAIARRAGLKTWQHRRSELVTTVVTLAIGIGPKLWNGEPGVSELVWVSVKIVLGVLSAFFSWFVLAECAIVHRQLSDQLEEYRGNINLAQKLRSRAEEVKRIGNDSQSMERLQNIQILIVRLLRGADTEWQTPPFGWEDHTVSELRAFGALVRVMGTRYPGEIHDFDMIYGDMPFLDRPHVPMLCEVTLECCMLVVRELEYPERYRDARTESPALFAETHKSFYDPV